MGKVTMSLVSSPYFKQLILGLWLGFCFTNFLDFNFNCDGYYYYDEALSARAKIKNQKVRGVLPFVFNFIRTAGKERF
jgi:hypothetical protein